MDTQDTETDMVPRWTGERRSFVDQLFAWLQTAGANRYDDAVTQYEHALQTAQNARSDDAGDAEIVAALLHDVGHLLMNEHRVRKDFLSCDLHHEEVGARWLSRFFPREVSNPVRLHVPAKRWLCADNESYQQALSAASRQSLKLQGGPLSEPERAEFEATMDWQEAVALRLRDDKAKQSGRRVPPIETYREAVLTHLIL